MGISYAPAAGQDVPAVSAPTLARLYVIDNGVEYEFRLTPPGAASLVVNPDGELEVDPAGTARVARGDDLSLIVY